jgi:hypothetical protein
VRRNVGICSWERVGMVGYGWVWLDMVGNGWVWMDMVGYGCDGTNVFVGLAGKRSLGREGKIKLGLGNKTSW